MSPIRDEWRTDDGSVRLLLGDCLEILPGLERGSVDCVVTSPPYNTLGSRIAGKPSGMHAESKWLSNTCAVGYADDMPEDKYQEWHNRVLGECAKSLSATGSLFVNHKCRWRDKKIMHPVKWISVDGCELRQEVIWRRAGSTTLNARMFAPNDERILWFVAGEKWTWNQPAASWLSIWDINQDRDANGHPCPYPEELPARCVAATTDKNHTVLDPFCGSGTTGVACIRLGRRFIGIEKEPKYFEIAKKRIRDELDKTRLIEKTPTLKQTTFLEPAEVSP